MNIHTLTPRPRLLVTKSQPEFDRVIERARAGEFKIETLTSMRTRTGQDNAVWRFQVYSADNAALCDPAHGDAGKPETL